MNKKGQIDFDFDMETLLPYILALLGAFIALFTASGGLSYLISGEKFNPGIGMKIASAVGGGIVGYVWGYFMTR